MGASEHRSFARLVEEVRDCTLCAEHLEEGPRPVLQVDPRARLLVVGQAPGRAVHASGVPFDDPSGDRLRDWTGLSRADFHDERRVAILPMGFCFPGTGRSGDAAPRPECADTWRARLLAGLPRIELTLLLGRFAIAWHLRPRPRDLTSAVRAWREHAPSVLPLPHPSPRNNRWLARNPWFEAELLPYLKRRVRDVVN